MSIDELRSQLFATVAEAAPLLRSDERTVRRAIEAGHVPAVKLSNKTLIPVRALLQLAGLDVDQDADVPAHRDDDGIPSEVRP